MTLEIFMSICMKMGFDRSHLIDSLGNRVQNEVHLTFYYFSVLTQSWWCNDFDVFSGSLMATVELSFENQWCGSKLVSSCIYPILQMLFFTFAPLQYVLHGFILPSIHSSKVAFSSVLDVVFRDTPIIWLIVAFLIKFPV